MMSLFSRIVLVIAICALVFGCSGANTTEVVPINSELEWSFKGKTYSNKDYNGKGAYMYYDGKILYLRGYTVPNNLSLGLNLFGPVNGTGTIEIGNAIKNGPSLDCAMAQIIEPDFNVYQSVYTESGIDKSAKGTLTISTFDNNKISGSFRCPLYYLASSGGWITDQTLIGTFTLKR